MLEEPLCLGRVINILFFPCKFAFFGFGDLSQSASKMKRTLNKCRSTSLKEEREGETYKAPTLPSRTGKRNKPEQILTSSCHHLFFWGGFLHHLAPEMCWRDTGGPLGAVSRALLFD